MTAVWCAYQSIYVSCGTCFGSWPSIRFRLSTFVSFLLLLLFLLMWMIFPFIFPAIPYRFLYLLPWLTARKGATSLRNFAIICRLKRVKILLWWKQYENCEYYEALQRLRWKPSWRMTNQNVRFSQNSGVKNNIRSYKPLRISPWNKQSTMTRKKIFHVTIVRRTI